MENDLILRQKLIDDLEAWRKRLDRRVSRFDDMVIHALPAVFDLVNEQETVEAEPKWISVEERLPERHGQLVVGLYNQHGADKSFLFPYVFTWHAYGENGYVKGPHFSDEGLDGLKVWYWMPLPEPPMDGGAEG